MQTQDPKLTTLFGGRSITVNFEPVPDPAAEGSFRVPDPEQIKVRQIPVRDFDAGFQFVKAKDEAALVAFLAGKPKAWALTLTPGSYEDILAAGREVNDRGFFSSCQRRMELEEKEMAAMIKAMGTLPPETLRLAAELGKKSISQTLPPGFVPPPVR